MGGTMDAVSLPEFLHQRFGGNAEGVPRVVRIVPRIAEVSIEVDRRIRQASAGLDTLHGGDQPDPADSAHQLFASALDGQGVRIVVSTEREEPVVLDPEGDVAVAIQPLAGARHLQVNGTTGTLFSVSSPLSPDASCLDAAPGAAGLVVYGPRTMLALTFGEGVALFTLDGRSGVYQLTDDDLLIPDRSHEYAVRSPDQWDAATRTFFEEAVDAETAEAPDIRWLDSLPAEVLRILMRGGAFLGGGESRGLDKGHAHLLCEARPIAFLVEQAGGRAWTGRERTLSRKATAFHDRVPVRFGSRVAIERLEQIYGRHERFADVSPLFGRRGLFRA
jgi:fructose-1,6-bisphosphatase I